jgi:hypothetical protein
MRIRGDNHEIGESYADEKDRYGVNKDNSRVEPEDTDREQRGGELLGINRYIH